MFNIINVFYGSKADINSVTHLCPLLGAKQTLDVRFLSPDRSCPSECPLTGVKRTLRQTPAHRRRFNGRNNGELHLTAEEVKTTLSMGTNTFVRVQRELQEKGFIRMTRQGGFHQRLPTLWALTDEPVGTKLPSHAYKSWTSEKQNIIAETATTSLPKRQRGKRANGSFIAETRTIEADSEPRFIAETATFLDICQGGGE